MRTKVIESSARYTRATTNIYLTWHQGSDIVEVVIGDMDAYYLRARARVRPISGRATMRSKAIEIYVRFPEFAVGKYSVNGAVTFLHQLGIQDISLFIEMCQGRGWAVQ